MKKAFISFLIMTLSLTSLSLVNISSVQAATKETNNSSESTDSTTKVSLEKIRDIMIDNSLDIKILNNDLNIAKEQYENAKDARENKPSKPNSADEDYDTELDTYNKELVAYNSAESAYKTAKDKLKTARNNYDKGVENKVYSAQEAYLAYLYDLSTKKINEDTVKSNEKMAQVYKLQYDSGFISKNTYMDKLQANTSVNDSNASKNVEELDRIKLCNTLGISPKENVTFETDITEDFKVISKINFNDDLEQMLDNNLDIKLKNDAIDDLDDEDDDSDSYDYNVDNAESNLKLVTNTAETDFKGKYNDLMTSYNSIKSSYDVRIQKQKEYEVTQTQYDYGFISKNELDNAKLTLDKENASFIKARNECYLKYLKYIEMKEGY